MNKTIKEIIIQDPSIILTFCIGVIRDLLKNNKLTTRENILDRKTIYTLSGDGCVIVEKKDVNYKDWAAPFILPYWLGMSIIFERTIVNKFKFSGIALRIYKGDFYLPNRNELFRAEWDFPLEANMHAQPHWHYCGWKEEHTKSDEGWQPENPTKDFESSNGEDTNSKTIGKIKDFHFAMSSTWHKDSGCKVNFEDPRQIKNWLNGCLKYIAKQLYHISK